MDRLTGPGLLAPERLDRPFQDPLVRRLFPPLATGVHWGLERTEAALRALGHPHRSYPSIHIGGTNGKGSVTSTLASVLHALESGSPRLFIEDFNLLPIRRYVLGANRSQGNGGVDVNFSLVGYLRPAAAVPGAVAEVRGAP